MTQLIPRAFGIASTLSALAALALGGCGEASRPFAPVTDQRTHSLEGAPTLALASVSGATQQYFEVALEFEGTITGFACLDQPVLFHVKGVSKYNVTTSPSGVISTRAFFQVDRDNTWVIYKGLTYHVAQGRQTGQDDVGHTLSGPGELYIESGVEPDFEVAETGERLRLNFQWQIVIDRDGNVRVSKVTGSCPLDFLG